MQIIIIDDNLEDIKELTAILNEAGHTITGTAQDGEKGLEVIRKEKPDVVFLDLVMDSMTGIEVLQTLQEEGNTIPTILCTTMGGQEAVVLAMKLGAFGYQTKPYQKEMVLTALERITRFSI